MSLNLSQVRKAVSKSVNRTEIKSAKLCNPTSCKSLNWSRKWVLDGYSRHFAQSSLLLLYLVTHAEMYPGGTKQNKPPQRWKAKKPSAQN